MRAPGKIHYGAPTTDGVWHPFCGAKPKGANCTPLVEYVECERCKKVIATCDDAIRLVQAGLATASRSGFAITPLGQAVQKQLATRE